MIIKNYNGKPDQILIDKGLVSKLDFLLNNNITKEFIAQVIKEELGLKQSDLILYKKGFILIKIIDDSKRYTVTESDKGTKAARYDGIDEKELEEFYKEFFSDDEHKDFFLTVAEEFVNKYLLEKKINNTEYEKFVFSYIQKIILNHLTKLYDNSDGFFTGFSGYLFRKNFKTVFEHITNFLLAEVAMSNHIIHDFLKYYMSGIVVIGGVKYQVPSMVTEDDVSLSVVSIVPIAKVYFKAKGLIEDFQNQIYKLAPQIKKLYINGVSPITFNNNLLKSIQSLKIKITNKTKRLKINYDSLEKISDKKLRLAKKQEKDILVKEINQFDKELKLFESKILESSVLKEYSKLQTELDSHMRHMKSQEKILQQNEKNYTSIRNSLVKALISKKKRIE